MSQEGGAWLVLASPRPQGRVLPGAGKERMSERDPEMVIVETHEGPEVWWVGSISPPQESRREPQRIHAPARPMPVPRPSRLDVYVAVFHGLLLLYVALWAVGGLLFLRWLLG